MSTQYTDFPSSADMAPEFASDRALQFVTAMSRAPEARCCELNAFRDTLNSLAVRDCSVIVDLGAGNGFLSRQVLPAYLCLDGVIYAVDVSNEMASAALEHPKVRWSLANLDSLPHASSSVDLVVSLAAFHHVLHKKQVLQEVKRVLKPGSYLVVADVHDNTPSQLFIDTIVKRHCSTGHDFDFVDEDWMLLLSNKVGMTHISTTIVVTPWRFNSDAELFDFVQRLFDLRVPIDKLREEMREIVPFCESDAIYLPWQLGYHVFKKP